MEAITLNVQLTLEQFIKAIEDLPREERAKFLEALEDYFLGKQIEATKDEELLSKEEALRYLEEGV